MFTEILEKAKSLGASLAGVTSTALLRNAPAYQASGQVEFPLEAKSILVLALAHDVNEPELDWWGVKEGTPGNQRLHQISCQIKVWLDEEYKIQVRPLLYHVEKGGIFLKDAAVLAGLGIIGANNLLITPAFGPRVRLRALFLDTAFAPLESGTFSPCASCPQPCRLACPRQAFSSGAYNRTRCAQQMHTDEAQKVLVAATFQENATVRIKYCRACELACPVGKK